MSTPYVVKVCFRTLPTGPELTYMTYSDIIAPLPSLVDNFIIPVEVCIRMIEEIQIIIS
jgi:hypothetical protein